MTPRMTPYIFVGVFASGLVSGALIFQYSLVQKPVEAAQKPAAVALYPPCGKDSPHYKRGYSDYKNNAECQAFLPSHMDTIYNKNNRAHDEYWDGWWDAKMESKPK